jgi:hypothetical protein
MKIEGVAKNTPIVQSDSGPGNQSPTAYRFDLIPPEVLFALANVFADGAKKYGEENWRGISCTDNLNKCLIHIFAFLAGDCQDIHLEHALTRLTFAIAKYYEGGDLTKVSKHYFKRARGLSAAMRKQIQNLNERRQRHD